MLMKMKYINERIMDELKEAKHYTEKASYYQREDDAVMTKLFLSMAEKKLSVTDDLEEALKDVYNRHKEHYYKKSNVNYSLPQTQQADKMPVEEVTEKEKEEHYKIQAMHDLILEIYDKFYNEVAMMIKMLKTPTH